MADFVQQQTFNYVDKGLRNMCIIYDIVSFIGLLTDLLDVVKCVFLQEERSQTCTA